MASSSRLNFSEESIQEWKMVIANWKFYTSSQPDKV